MSYYNSFDKEAIFQRMDALQLSLVTVNYDGYGDSGSVQYVEVEGLYGPVELENESESFFSECAILALSSKGIDWYNNEGGFGNVVFDAENKVARIEHNERVESSIYSEYGV